MPNIAMGVVTVVGVTPAAGAPAGVHPWAELLGARLHGQRDHVGVRHEFTDPVVELQVLRPRPQVAVEPPPHHAVLRRIGEIAGEHDRVAGRADGGVEIEVPFTPIGTGGDSCAVTVPPDSVVVSPVNGVTVTPAVSLSVLVTVTSAGLMPL